jgi:replicative DNA helicase
MDIKEIEKRVFRKLISNPKTLPANLNKVSPEDFSIPHLRQVIEAFGQNGNSIHYAPSKEYFEIMLRDRFVEKDKLDQFASMLAGLAAKPEDQSDLEVLAKELKNNRMCSEMARIIEDTSRLVEPGRIEEAYDSMLKRLLQLPMSGTMAHSVGTVTEVDSDVEDRLSMYFKPAKKKFACGPKAFTDSNGGYAPGELIVLLAPTGGGKSTIMLWWANEFLKAGGNVLYVTIEMSYEETMERYHSMITGLSVQRLRNRTLSENEVARYNMGLVLNAKAPTSHDEVKREFARVLDRTNPHSFLEIGRKFENRKNKFFVLDIPNNCTPARIDREISRLSLDCPIHFVVIDYLNIMKPNFHSKDHVREQASIAQDLKGVARKSGSIILTAGQLNTSNLEDDAKITTDNAKYCRAIGENCDWMPAFMQSEQDKMMKQIKIQLAKHRFSAQATALLQVDFDTMQIKDLGDADRVAMPEPTYQQQQDQRSQEYSRAS